MKKNINKLVLFFSVLILVLVILPEKSQAGSPSKHKLDLTVHTIIDNIHEMPDELKTKEFTYSAERITKMLPLYNDIKGHWRYSHTGKNWASAPAYDQLPVIKDFKWTHDGTVTLNYSEIKTYINTVWFTPSASKTDSHLSLESVELNSNLKRFTYDDDGFAKYPVSPYDWVEIIDDSEETAELTLHFRYNPDIDGIEVEDPEIDPSYSKKIDFLGDNTKNPGESIENNNYRLHLDMHSGEDWRIEEDKEKDIIFVLDISSSMTANFEGDRYKNKDEKIPYPDEETRIYALKKTMKQAIKTLTKNENNMISIIQFDKDSEILTKNGPCNNKENLIDIVEAIKTGEGTDFYAALEDVETIVHENPEREKSIFFISDGRPHAAWHASERDLTSNRPAALAYTHNYAEKFPKVKDFFSIYIGEEEGHASILQTMTQKIRVDREKYTIQVTDPDQLDDAFDRYMTRFGVVFNDVTITDELTEYADYVGNLKVHMFEEGKDKVELEKDVDYEILAENDNEISVEILIDIEPEITYELSFEIKASEEARKEYESNKLDKSYEQPEEFEGSKEEYEPTDIYPHIGDPGTNYPGNMSSAGKAGFYSNELAELTYNTGSETIVKEYPKPVLQIHPYNPVEAEVEFIKSLTGKDLEDDEFEFELREIQKDSDTEDPFSYKIGNKDNGIIPFGTFKFTKPGKYSFEVKEIIPENKKPGYTYDDRVLNLVVDVATNDKDVLEADVRYVDGSKFLNRYTAEPVSVNFRLQKEMIDKELNAGDYRFRLFDGNMEPIEVVANRANGDILFKPIEFTKPSIHQFIVKEIIPNPMNPNIQYDLSPSKIKVDVIDEGGELKADVSYGKEKFTNRYREEKKEEENEELKIEFEVVLSGMQLYPGMFEFELKGDDGEYSKVTNRSDGSIIFEDIIIKKAGKYTVKQVNTQSIEHMNYDKEGREVIVEKVDGELKVIYEPENIFYNKYKFSGRIW